MKISCQSCAAKYTIADEKVVGKVIKIKCKKCGATIVVNGNDPAYAAADQGGASAAYGGPPDASTGADEWTVSVTDDDQRSMTTADVVAAYQRGELTPDTYLWREGMAGWLPLNQVPELADALQNGGGAQADDDPAATAIFGHSPLQATPLQTTPMGGAPAPQSYAEPVAAAAAPLPAAPAAARKPRTQKVDLFGGGGGPVADAHGLPSAVGERNETSVLFSLSALQAAEASAVQPHRPTPSRGAPGMNSDRVDDILGLGGGGVAPILAPPPLMAPIVEPPPPPKPISVAPPPTSYAPAGMAMYQAPPQKKAPVALIAGGGVAALALVGGLAFFLGRGTDKPTPETPTTTAAAESKKEEPKEEPKADAPKGDATATTAPVETAAPVDTGADAKTAATPPTGGTIPPSTGAGAKFDPTKKDPKDEKKDPKVEEKADPKDEKKDPPSTSGAPFDRGAASAALGAAAGSAKSCGKPGGPTGSGKVQVTFAPSGKATQATVGAPFAGTPVGSCIAGIFRGSRVPAFAGEPMTVSKTVSIK